MSQSADRQPVAAGSYYNGNRNTLMKDVSDLFAECVKTTQDRNVRAIICPHAGYVFSGKVAASAISSTPKDAEYKNIFLIGSSHVMAFNGASVFYTGDFITPFGKAQVNTDLATKLRNENKVFDFPVTAHLQEHSLEVQIPLIQYYYQKVPEIVPIILGTNNTNTIKLIAEALRPYFTPDNLFLISSDFSHYPSYEDANETDRKTAEGILSGDPDLFLRVLRDNSSDNIDGLATSMCGWTSGLMLMYLARGDDNLEYKRIDYCNSGDTPYGDKDRVVGYHALALIEKVKNTDNDNKENAVKELSFSRSEINILFDIARNSIKSMLDEKKRIDIDGKKMPVSLKQNLGAFVTLKIDGRLRGCIGRFISSDPLYEVVRASALSSAFEDSRFLPLTKEEYEKTDMEITILGPLQRIYDPDDIILGKHGIYIKKDYRSGTMLPQVATENGWSIEEFLGYTSREKAGLGWDGWKNAELYVYEGLVLEENK